MDSMQEAFWVSHWSFCRLVVGWRDIICLQCEVRNPDLQLSIESASKFERAADTALFISRLTNWMPSHSVVSWSWACFLSVGRFRFRFLTQVFLLWAHTRSWFVTEQSVFARRIWPWNFAKIQCLSKLHFVCDIRKSCWIASFCLTLFPRFRHYIRDTLPFCCFETVIPTHRTVIFSHHCSFWFLLDDGHGNPQVPVVVSLCWIACWRISKNVVTYRL